MKNNKIGRYLIILLVIIVIPTAIYSIYYNNLLEKEYGNPKHLDRVDNTLYFYNEADELMGFYECKNPECSLAYTSTEDEDNFEQTFESQITTVYGRTVFIDDNGIKMFVMSSTGDNKEIKMAGTELDLVKDYGGALQKYVICKVKDSDSYFIIDKETGTTQLSGYKFIGLNRLIDQERFIVNKEDEYNIIGVDSYNTINSLSERIIDYTASYIMTKNENGIITILDRTGDKVYLTDVKKYNVLSDFVVIQKADGVYIYNPDLETTLDSKLGENITYEIDGEEVQYYDGKDIVDTFSSEELAKKAEQEAEKQNTDESQNTDNSEPKDGEV